LAKNKLSDLRDHLFETLEALKDKDTPMEIERAKAIALVAGTIIDSASVEVKFADVIGERPDGTFFDKTGTSSERQLPAPRRGERATPGDRV
jgi:hypothetical protein